MVSFLNKKAEKHTFKSILLIDTSFFSGSRISQASTSCAFFLNLRPFPVFYSIISCLMGIFCLSLSFFAHSHLVRYCSKNHQDNGRSQNYGKSGAASLQRVQDLAHDLASLQCREALPTHCSRLGSPAQSTLGPYPNILECSRCWGSQSPGY